MPYLATTTEATHSSALLAPPPSYKSSDDLELGCLDTKPAPTYQPKIPSKNNEEDQSPINGNDHGHNAPTLTASTHSRPSSNPEMTWLVLSFVSAFLSAAYILNWRLMRPDLIERFAWLNTYGTMASILVGDLTMLVVSVHAVVELMMKNTKKKVRVIGSLVLLNFGVVVLTILGHMMVLENAAGRPET